MLEFVDSGLYFVQDENNYINLLLHVKSGYRSNEKITESGSGSSGAKINGPDRFWILIPVRKQTKSMKRSTRLFFISSVILEENYLVHI